MSIFAKRLYMSKREKEYKMNKIKEDVYMNPNKLLNQKDRCVYLQFAYLGDCKICKEPVYGTPPKENLDRFNFHPVVHSECYRKLKGIRE